MLLKGFHLCLIHHAALQYKAGLRSGRKFLKIGRLGCAKKAFGGYMQANRLRNRRGIKGRQKICSYFFMNQVFFPAGILFKQMPDIVQEGRYDQFWIIRICRKMGRLHRMLVLRYKFIVMPLPPTAKQVD